MIYLTLKDLALFAAELSETMSAHGVRCQEAAFVMMDEQGNSWVRTLTSSGSTLLSKVGLLEVGKSLLLQDSLLDIEDVDEEDDEDVESSR